MWLVLGNLATRIPTSPRLTLSPEPIRFEFDEYRTLIPPVRAAARVRFGDMVLGDIMSMVDGRLVVFDRHGDQHEITSEDAEKWRNEGACALAWCESLMPDTWGNWFTDEIGIKIATGRITWRSPRHHTAKLAHAATVLVPDQRLAGGQMLTLVSWLVEHGERGDWERVGSTFGFHRCALASYFMLTWQSTEITTYTVPRA